MAGATGNLELASDHLESFLLVLQMFHDDAKVLCHCSHLFVKTLLQIPLSFFRHGGSPTQLRSNDSILIVVLGSIPHYHILAFGIWDNLVVNVVQDFEGFLVMLQGDHHRGGNIKSNVGV